MADKRLYRSVDNAMIGGVCAGFADYLDADTTIIRLVWVALVLFGGTGILAYILAWIIMPPKPPGLP